jgi:FtsZ-interacting cell division protein YlmF
MLFLIKPGGDTMTVRIHPALFTKGFPELDRINGLARQLLVRYYSNCEAIYKAGMDIIVSSKMAEKDAADKLEQQKQQAQQQAQQAQQQAPQQPPPQQQNKPLVGKVNQSQSIVQQPVRLRGGKTRKAIRTTSQRG